MILIQVTKSDMLDKIPGTRTAHMDIEDNKVQFS